MTKSEHRVLAWWHYWEAGDETKWHFYSRVERLVTKRRITIRRVCELTGLKRGVVRDRLNTLRHMQ